MVNELNERRQKLINKLEELEKTTTVASRKKRSNFRKFKIGGERKARK